MTTNLTRGKNSYKILRNGEIKNPWEGNQENEIKAEI